jgi:hypothetical protein
VPHGQPFAAVALQDQRYKLGRGKSGPLSATQGPTISQLLNTQSPPCVGCQFHGGESSAFHLCCCPRPQPPRTQAKPQGTLPVEERRYFARYQAPAGQFDQERAGGGMASAGLVLAGAGPQSLSLCCQLLQKRHRWLEGSVAGGCVGGAARDRARTQARQRAAAALEKHHLPAERKPLPGRPGWTPSRPPVCTTPWITASRSPRGLAEPKPARPESGGRTDLAGHRPAARPQPPSPWSTTCSWGQRPTNRFSGLEAAMRITHRGRDIEAVPALDSGKAVMDELPSKRIDGPTAKLAMLHTSPAGKRAALCPTR